jgi:hypothetical protein
MESVQEPIPGTGREPSRAQQKCIASARGAIVRSRMDVDVRGCARRSLCAPRAQDFFRRGEVEVEPTIILGLPFFLSDGIISVSFTKIWSCYFRHELRAFRLYL